MPMTPNARRSLLRCRGALFNLSSLRSLQTPPRLCSTLLTMASDWTLGCDANDPHRLAQFWARALGYISEPGYDDPDGASIIDPDGRKPAIGWLRVTEPKLAKNRLHIDIRVAG